MGSMSHPMSFPARKDGANVGDGYTKGPQTKSTRDPIDPNKVENFKGTGSISAWSWNNPPIPKEAVIFAFCSTSVFCLVGLMVWCLPDARAAAKVARPNLYIRLVAVEGLDPRESPPASPSFHLVLDAEKVSWRYRACNGGGNSMLRVSYCGMILAWGKVPSFCVDSSQSSDNVATVEAKAAAAVLREEVRDLIWRELQVVGMVEFDVEGEVAGLGYAHGKPFLSKGKAAEVSKGVQQ